MKLEFPHSFNQEEAVARVQALTTYWRKHGIQSDWTGNSAFVKGKVKGISFEGTMVVKDRALSADMKVGFLAEKLGGRAYVERKLGEYLDPKNNLEDLQKRAL
jgi:hypothetical protein